LEDVIEEAIRQNFDTFALTEHMPRDNPEDLYPEEVSIVHQCPYRETLDPR
jgi:histidinol-phosphatase (PHP family)